MVLGELGPCPRTRGLGTQAAAANPLAFRAGSPRARSRKGFIMAEPLRIALAGLGTVGAGVIRLIETNAALIARRAGRPIVITAVSARDRTQGPRRRSFALCLGRRHDRDGGARRRRCGGRAGRRFGRTGADPARATRSRRASRWSPPTRR
jgi:hypothetical protein